MYRAHRGPRNYVFRAHLPLRKKAVFESHTRRKLRPKRKRRNTTPTRGAKVAKYRSQTYNVPSSYRQQKKPAPYKPARPAATAAAVKAARKRAGRPA